jgi:hypothetical protein
MHQSRGVRAGCATAQAPKIIGALKILDICMYINNKIYWFVRNMGQNFSYKPRKRQTWAMVLRNRVIHCLCMYLNQWREREREDMLDLKQSTGADNTVSRSRPSQDASRKARQTAAHITKNR